MSSEKRETPAIGVAGKGPDAPAQGADHIHVDDNIGNSAPLSDGSSIERKIVDKTTVSTSFGSKIKENKGIFITLTLIIVAGGLGAVYWFFIRKEDEEDSNN